MKNDPVIQAAHRFTQSSELSPYVRTQYWAYTSILLQNTAEARANAKLDFEFHYEPKDDTLYVIIGDNEEVFSITEKERLVDMARDTPDIVWATVRVLAKSCGALPK